VWLAIVASIPQVLGLIFNFMAKKSIKTLEKNTNGIKNALLEVTATSKHAEGVIAGREQMRAQMRAGDTEDHRSERADS